jgi:hypothetical protein
MPIGFVTLVFVAFISLAVVTARQFTGELGHLVPESWRILVFAALIVLFRHCKPSL